MFTKKVLYLLLGVSLLLGTISAAYSAETMSNDEIIKLFNDEMHFARYHAYRGAAYEYESFQKYLSYWFQKVWSVTDYKKVSILDIENKQELLEKLVALRKNLVQVCDPESVSWYIWGDNGNNIAQAEDAAYYDYTMMQDEAGFKPFLVPYMLEDQSKVKGNMVIVAGGGFLQRCNDNEGDPIAVYWRSRGYNCFILNRRVAPSQPIDASLDLQRAIRYIRYNAEKLGIAKPETIITMGFSGGGMTIVNQLKSCYGNLTPDVIYPAYKCDEVDAVNADYNVAVIMYGVLSSAEEPYTSENPNMPAFFLFTGEIDNKVTPQNVAHFYTIALENKWPVEFYAAGNTHHGIGIAGVRAFSNVGYTNSLPYREALETYLDVQLGYKPATFTPCECVPICEPATCKCDGCVTKNF